MEGRRIRPEVDPPAFSALLSTTIRGETPSGTIGSRITVATSDQVPSLIKHLDSSDPFMINSALDALGTVKDARGIEPIARFLGVFGKDEAAVRALITIGPSVETEVRKYLMHNDQRARSNAERVLKGIGKTGQSDAYLAALGAIKSKDNITKGLKWFENNEPTPDKQAEAAKVMAGLLKHDSPFVRDGTGKAMLKWATKDEVPALIDYLTEHRKDLLGLAPFLRTLARLRDERAIPIVTQLLDSPANADATKTLIAIGGPQVEEAMVQVLGDPARKYVAKSNACKVLQQHGTAKSLEPLQQAKMAAERVKYAGWRDVQQASQEAMQAINSRKQKGDPAQ